MNVTNILLTFVVLVLVGLLIKYTIQKNKKYELKKALKGCTYGDVNDKRYVKTLIYDLLLQEYGVNEINISKAIPFDLFPRTVHIECVTYLIKQ